MDGKIVLKEGQRAQLLLLIGKAPLIRTLKDHYSKHKSDYGSWARKLFDNPEEFAGEKKYYRGESLVSALAEKIKRWDGGLHRIVNHPESIKALNMDLETVCDLFARNSWAENPVAPGEEYE